MRFTRAVAEMISTFTNGLRSPWRLSSSNYYPVNPIADKTTIDYDLARQLYRNDGADTSLGAGFCRRIINHSVDAMGIPQASSDNSDIDTYLNTAISRHWRPQLVEMFRNAMRDSKTIVRVWEPLLDDPLATEDERQHCCLTLYEPERVRISRDRQNPNIISRAIIVQDIEWDDPVQPILDPQRGTMPQVKTHEVWEIITPDKYRYYDKTDNQRLDDWAMPNPLKFVPIIEVWNEYDSALGGGQSDLESSYPFVKAFHEVLRQSLQAHKYHSVPKLKFKVGDIAAFLQANFPETIDENGKVIAGSTIKWEGREVLLMGQEDDLGFVEMKSILADSKTMLEFLIDCISISSETPEWALMRVEGGTSQGALNAQTIPSEKRVERKRNMFQEPVQMICKMALKMSGRAMERVEIIWSEMSTESLQNTSQAVQFFVQAAEVLMERKIVSEDTVRAGLKHFPLFNRMKDPQTEAADAKKNLTLTPPAPPAVTPTNGKGNTKNIPPVSALNKGGKNE